MTPAKATTTRPRITRETLLFGGLLILLALLCYGQLIPWLGFYWDDFSYLYSLHVNGPQGFIDYVARDRPFSAGIYMVTASLFGTNPLPYQILNLGLRLLCAVGLSRLLRTLWPKQGSAHLWAPLAFLVYPGFWQQPIPFIYNLHWANLAQELFSLVCMLRALGSGGKAKWGWTAVALALMLNVFSLEYAFGLEGLRPLLLFLALGGAAVKLPLRRRALRQRLGRVLKEWLPYLLVNAAFLTWTLLIFNNNMYDPGGRVQSLDLVARLQSLARDVFQVGLLPWLHVFEPLGELNLSSLANGLFWLAAGAGGLLVIFSGLRLIPRAKPAEKEDGVWAGQVALLGLWALIVAGIPLWGVGLDPETRFPYDRFTLPFTVGAAILVAAFLEGLVRGRLRKIILFAGLIGLAAGAQFQNTNTFRREWANLPLFLGQLAARAPGLQPGTLLLTHDLPFQYYSDHSLSGLLNIQYAPEQRDDSTMRYFLMYMGDRAGGSLPGLQPGLDVSKNYRSFDFQGSTSQALVLFYSPPGCLRVLDPARAHELPELPEVYREALALSRLDVIETDPARAALPPGKWFSPLDEGSWCAAFEQADLARQRGDWQGAARIGAEAMARGLRPGEWSELGVFVEARARLGDPVEALELLQPALEDAPAGKAFACKEWDYLVREGLAEPAELGCPARMP